MGNVRYPQLRKKSAVPPLKRSEKELIDKTYSLFVTVAFGVLDSYGWTDDEMEIFKRDMDELAGMMEEGVEDWETMKRIIEERMGIKLS